MVIGTRPEAIKLAPVINALAHRGLPPRLILTGQHPLDTAQHGIAVCERIVLDCPGGGDPIAHADAVARAVSLYLAQPPDLLIVQGDTSSALGGALAAFAAAIPVAHVEAGLRSFDPAMPWPEEQFRTAIDAGSALLFAPTEISAANLEAEGVPGSIFVTGNTGIDALLALGEPRSMEASKSDNIRLLVTCHRRESWGHGLQSIAGALIELAARHSLDIALVLHPNPQVAGTMQAVLAGNERIRLIPPLPHSAMIDAMRRVDILLSDSGGIQEEAPALGVPLLVLRDKTERPEGVASGNTLLVGTSRSKIVETVERLLDPVMRAAMSRRAFPFGDGRSADRIADRIEAFLTAETIENPLALRA